MRSLPRLFAVSTLVLALGACTGGGSTSAGPSSSEPTATASTIPSGPISFVEGEYRTEYADVTADLSWNGGTGELHVVNASELGLEAPALHAVTSEPATVDASVEGAAPIAAGEEATFAVAFPETLEPVEAGLIILSFGDESWGAMAPVVAE